MKTLFLLSLVCIFPCKPIAYAQKITPVKENKFLGTYNGLNENVEFEFISDNGKIFTFQEVGDEVKYDLYEEQNFSKRFEVIWVTETIETLDEEGESTGKKEQIKVITSLKEL